MKKPILSIGLWIWFQLGWWLCIFAERLKSGPILILVLALSGGLGWRYFRFWIRSPLFYGSLLIGLLFDGTCLAFDVMKAEGQSGLFGPHLPYWLMAMWFHFVALAPLMLPMAEWKRPYRILLGALMGPLTYWSGNQLQVLTLQGFESLFILGVFWAWYFDFLVANIAKLNKRNSGLNFKG